MMRIVVLTGMSGSGKTHALQALEDLGYYAIDNLPISLLEQLVELMSISQGEVKHLALVMDVRTLQGQPAAGDPFLQVPTVLDATRKAGHDVELVFMECDDEILARRFSETRRRHPLSADGAVRDGLLEERRMLQPLKRSATMQVDTTQMSVHDLKRKIQAVFSARGEASVGLSVTVISFGFKHGIPTQADLVFDVRFLPNPYFVESMRAATGESSDVIAYVLDRPETAEFLAKLEDMMTFLLPCYEREGKAYLTVAIGCTGGRHRSVAIANRMGAWLTEKQARVQVRHRDIDR